MLIDCFRKGLCHNGSKRGYVASTLREGTKALMLIMMSKLSDKTNVLFMNDCTRLRFFAVVIMREANLFIDLYSHCECIKLTPSSLHSHLLKLS